MGLAAVTVYGNCSRRLINELPAAISVLKIEETGFIASTTVGVPGLHL